MHSIQASKKRIFLLGKGLKTTGEFGHWIRENVVVEICCYKKSYRTLTHENFKLLALSAQFLIKLKFYRKRRKVVYHYFLFFSRFLLKISLLHVIKEARATYVLGNNACMQSTGRCMNPLPHNTAF